MLALHKEGFKNLLRERFHDGNGIGRREAAPAKGIVKNYSSSIRYVFYIRFILVLFRSIPIRIDLVYVC